MSDLVGNPEDRFSRIAAHFITNSWASLSKKCEALVYKSSGLTTMQYWLLPIKTDFDMIQMNAS